MTVLEELLLLTARVFLPVVMVLAGLGYVFVEAPTGFTMAVATMTALAACMVSAARTPARRRVRAQRDS